MKMSDLVPLDDVLERRTRQELWIETTAEAFELLTELWPQAKNGGGVYPTADQWARLRQVLLKVADLGD